MTNTRKLAIVAVLSALSFLLMLYEIPLITEFLKLDFSIIPILLALVVLDFKSSMAVLLIRSALKLALNNHGIGTLIGLPMNILAVTVFVSAFALLWKKRKSLSDYVKASLVATLGLTVTMIVLNVIYAVPLFARFAGFDIYKTYGLYTYLLTMIVPFDILAGVIWAVVFWLVYTLLQPVLKRYEK